MRTMLPSVHGGRRPANEGDGDDEGDGDEEDENDDGIDDAEADEGADSDAGEDADEDADDAEDETESGCTGSWWWRKSRYRGSAADAAFAAAFDDEANADADEGELSLGGSADFPDDAPTRDC
jgi:hypothetical protein